MCVWNGMGFYACAKALQCTDRCHPLHPTSAKLKAAKLRVAFLSFTPFVLNEEFLPLTSWGYMYVLPSSEGEETNVSLCEFYLSGINVWKASGKIWRLPKMCVCEFKRQSGMIKL